MSYHLCVFNMLHTCHRLKCLSKNIYPVQQFEGRA